MGKFISWFKRIVRPSLCADCRTKMDRKFGLRSKIKHKARKHYHKARSKFKYIRVKMRHGKSRRQRVMVLASGKYRFVKNK